MESFSQDESEKLVTTFSPLIPRPAHIEFSSSNTQKWVDVLHFRRLKPAICLFLCSAKDKVKAACKLLLWSIDMVQTFWALYVCRGKFWTGRLIETAWSVCSWWGRRGGSWPSVDYQENSFHQTPASGSGGLQHPADPPKCLSLPEKGASIKWI